MNGERLFGAGIPPACKYCEHVLQFLGPEKMLCEKRGVVQPVDKCRHFVYDPLKRVPKKPKPLQKLEETEFVL
jgi:hypothetical protein